jgi:hypothetical protein
VAKGLFQYLLYVYITFSFQSVNINEKKGKFMEFNQLSPNQLRVTMDLTQSYEAYRDAKQRAARYAGGFSWKTVRGREYLVKVLNRHGGTKSFGPRSPATEAIFTEFVAGKARAKERESSLEATVQELAGMARGILVARVPSVVTATLRKLDDFGFLGKNLIVIGTNAMYGYEAVAGVQVDTCLLATTDVDLLWDSRATLKLASLDADIQESGLLAILRKVDRTFEPMGRGGFRAINNNGFYVDLVKQAPNPPWKKDEPEKMAESDLTPSWLPNIKWLLSSEKFKSTVIGQDGLPAPMVGPDPRAFAVYKQWLCDQPDREPVKKQRDRLQARAVIELVRERLQNLPLDDNAERMFPKSVRTLSGGFTL